MADESRNIVKASELQIPEAPARQGYFKKHTNTFGLNILSTIPNRVDSALCLIGKANLWSAVIIRRFRLERRDALAITFAFHDNLATAVEQKLVRRFESGEI